MSDLKELYKSLKSRPGSGFIVSKTASGIEVDLVPPAKITEVKKKVRAAPLAVGGTFAMEEGKPVFTIKQKKGKLALNTTLTMAVKNELGLSAQPSFVEAGDCEDLDAKPTQGLETEESEGSELEGLDSLDQFDVSGLDGLDTLEMVEEPLSLDQDTLGGLDTLDAFEEDENEAEEEPSAPSPGSFVRAQQARLMWTSARKSAQSTLEALASAIVKDYPDEAATANGVKTALSELSEDLVDDLDDLLNAKGLNDPKAQAKAVRDARKKALQTLSLYKSYVTGSELLAHLDENPFGVGSVTKPLLGTLAEIEKGINA